jgi:hypothetical protein
MPADFLIAAPDYTQFESPQKHSWQDNSPCAEVGFPEFFPNNKQGGDVYGNARKICRTRCLVRTTCLEYQMEYEGDVDINHRAGMFGGLTPRERYELAKERGLITEELEVA